MSYFKELPSKMKVAFMRFPITLLWVILGSFFTIYIINDGYNWFDNYFSELTVLSIGVSWLIGARFLKENLQNKIIGWLIKSLILIGLFIFYITLPNNDDANSISYTRSFILLLAGHIFVFFAPFATRWNKIDYWNYLKLIITAIGRSALFSIIMYAGLSLALLAIENLFSINFSSKIYGDLFIICLGIVNTFIYLSDFPKQIHHTQEIHYSKALDVLLKYILIPILLLYLVIVYAYSIKIIITWELPQGWVSYLITILSIVGFIIHLIIEPIREKHPNLIIRKFYPVFYFLLFPLFILLFIAIYTRVNDYGFTENRYFLSVLTAWIIGITLYVLLSKKKVLSILPISLFLLCLISIYGPWSAHQVSIKSQVNRLSELILKTDKGEHILSEEEVNQFKSSTRFLKEKDKLYLLENNLGFSTSYIENTYSAGSKLLDSIYGNKAYKLPNTNDYLSFYYNDFTYNEELNVQGYDKLVIVNTSNTRDEKYFLDIKEDFIILNYSDSELFRYNIIEDIKAKLKVHSNLNEASKESFEYEITNDIGKFKFIIKSINGSRKNNKALEIYNLKAYVFISYKKF
ncbi:protein of unknown function [Mesonia phycicola]|uniref:DUF4153 domain-containing protein n=1 Tax=Mesonia phycicola TaxID=579105 RepID=A0A1M6EJ15_9FLAO|nr:DUF4153 domain-containing protein [Mesonia phycicola]SHI85495.1 protein of unknown function [Mesonia phycicola]